MLHARSDSKRVTTQGGEPRIVILTLERSNRRLLDTHRLGNVALQETGLLASLDEGPAHLVIGLSKSRRVLNQLIKAPLLEGRLDRSHRLKSITDRGSESKPWYDPNGTARP